MQYKIMVVEDDADISELLAKILRASGYGVVQAFSGTEAKLLFDQDLPDLLLLDLRLPGIPGEELLRIVRDKDAGLPVLVISAKNSLQDKVSLLKNGADDYITKPFEPEEVTARVQAGLRRSGKKQVCRKNYVYKKLKLYPGERKAVYDRTELALTAHEFDILQILMQNPGRVYSRESLYELVWQGGYYGENNTVNVHVSNLRRKIKESGSAEGYIQTVYGIGFKLP